MIRSDYLQAVFDKKSLKTIVRKVSAEVRILKPDAIVCRGVSGISVAFPVGLRCSVPVVVVRKPRDGSHSRYRTEGTYSFNSYVIVDDFILSGTTLREISAGVVRHAAGPPACTAVITYIGIPNYKSKEKQAQVHEFFGEQCKLIELGDPE